MSISPTGPLAGKRGKTDAVDAEAAARAVLSGRSASIAKTGDGMVEVDAAAQAGPGFGSERPDQGDQPAHGHPCRRRPRAARITGRHSGPAR